MFSYYSDLKLQESPETRALVLTEFQTGRGERIDMLVHGIKFVAQGGNAEEYTPIGLELKASRQGKGAQALLKEANNQINEEYKEGVTYKTLTDSDEVKFIGVVFDKGSNNPNRLILTSRTAEEGFIPVGVVHSSVHMLPTCSKGKKREPSSPEYPPSKKPRRERSVSMACVDSFDEEKITEEEKEQRIKELFNADKVAERVKNIEFYDQLFKVSQKISEGEIIDKNVEEAFVAKIKDVDLNSIDPEIRDIVKEMKDNIENKEEVKNVLRRSGVTEKIGKVAEGAGLAFTAFLVGKHIANGDIEGLGYDALNLWVMPKIGEKISGKILELGTKLDSQMLKGFAPAMGRAIGNFAAFLGLAESIKARQSATDPVDIKIADLNIATNSIFIAADVPAVVTETMSVAGLETGVVGEFAGPVGAAVSVAVIIISQFVEAGLEVEKLTEQMSLTDQEKHDLYWDFFLGKKVPDYIERDIGVENIYKQYMSKILDQFKSEYDTIAISLPSILITKEKYVTNNNSRKKRQGEEITNWLRARDRCITRTRVVNNEFGFDLSTNITHPFHMSGTSHYSRIIPGVIKNYNLVCGPLDDNVVKVTEELLSGSIWDVSSGWSCGNSSPHNNEVLSKTREEWSLQKYMTDCYNAALYNKSNSSGLAKMLFYMSNDYAFISVASNYTIDVLFNGKNILLNSYGINNQGSSAQNRYYFTKQLSNCDVHKQGTNFFYIAKDNFVCNLGGSSAGQSNTVITRGNFKDSEDIHSVIGSNEANHIEVSHAGYVDGKGGNDVITAKNFTAIKGYFGDSIRGKGLVLLPINFSDIDNITHVNNITTIYNKSGAFISVDKQTSVKTADGLFVTPTKIDGKTGVVTNLHVTKSLSSDIVLDDELDNLRKIDNSNFNITKQLSSANYHSTIGSSSNHIFYPDKEHHNFYWEAPSNISHLYLFDNRNANITIAQANGILDFSQLNCTLDDMPFTENNEGEIKINKNGLNVTLLPNYKDVTVTFNGEEYYKLQNGELERDYCSHSLRIDGRFSVNGTDLLNHHNCFTFDSEKVLFLKLNNNLLLLSDRGALSISDYYSSVNKNWDLSIELNNRIMEPEEFGERADDFSSFRYYKPDEQGLQIYHNQPINKNDIGLVDLKDKSILDFDMKVINDNLLLSYKNNTLVKVENWNSYQPAREMMFAFNDKMVSNSKCIASTCNSGDVIVDFNEVIVRILKLNKELLLAVRSHELNEVKNLISQGASLEAKDDDDNTPLHWASWNSYLDVVDYLIKSGANLEAKNRYGRTPLLNASWNGHLDVVKYLVENGANLEAKDYNGKTPLHMASLIGHLDVVKYLISKGADINAKANDGKTPLDIAINKKHDNVEQYLKQVQLDKKLLTAMEGVDLNEVRGLIAKGANIDTKDKDGNTLLYSAAEMGDLDRIKFLLDNGANIETENGEYQATPLHGAVENYRLDAVKLLLSRGANVNAEDKGHWTPLHYAADTNRLDVVKFLVGAGANLGATSDYGKTPLDIAIDKKHVNVEQYLRQVQLDKKLLLAVRSHELNEVKNLISQGASLEAKDGDDNTPLHWASWNSYLDIVEYLIKSDANLEAKNRYGRTPLLNASWNGHLDVVKYLVENGANLEAKDYNGKTPLYRASLIGHLDVVKYLISKGASINAKDKDGKTPLDIAIDKKLDNVVAYLRQTQLGLNEQLLAVVRDGDFNKVKDLVGRGASLDIQDSNNGWTPIIYAAQGSKWDMVKFLIAQGAKFNNEITYQGTPLHFAAQEGNSNMVQFLLDKGADIEAQNAYNKKPLHLAVEAGKLKVVRLLLDRGANIKAADMYGQTPLDLAIKKGYEDIVEVLKQKQLDLDKELLIAAEKGDIEKVRDSIRQGANVNVQGRQGWTPVFWAIQKNNFNIIELLLDNNADIKVKDNEGWTPLHWAVQLGSLDVVERLVERGADVNALTADGRTPYDLAINQNYREVKEYLRSKSAVPSSMLIPDDSVRQRKRRHHHGDHSRNHNHSSHKFLSVDSSNQPEIAANSGTRPSLWINGLFGWVKGSVGGLFYSRAALSEEASNTASSIPQVDEQFAKASVSSSSSTSTTLPSDGTDKKQENGGFFRDNIDYVNANIKQMRERQTPVKFKPSGGNTILEMGDHYLSQIDFNGTIMLLDLLIRKVTGQKYISTVDQSISPLEAQGYALNITEGFEKVVEQAGLKSGVSMHRLNIDFVEIQKEVTGKIMSGKFDEISGVLNSYLEEACPGREAGCPGKLSPKKFDKFIAQFNKDLLNQSIEQILHNRDGTLEVDGTKKQQMSLEPQSYLSNASVHSHSEVSTCLSEIGVTKLGGNLNR
ncbi:MAG: ankyrin repeat domain-containing protein [Wolbachia sp.]